MTATAIIPLNPLDDPGAWDVLAVGSSISPGVIVSISGGGINYKWDKKRGKGVQGVTLTYTGEDPPQITVEIAIGYAPLGALDVYAAIRQQWADLQVFIQALKYDPTKKNIQAVDISHPALAMVDITSVVTEEIGMPERTRAGDSEYHVKFKFTPYKPAPPTPAVSSPTTSAPDTTNAAKAGEQPTSAPDKQQQELASLLAQAQKP